MPLVHAQLQRAGARGERHVQADDVHAAPRGGGRGAHLRLQLHHGHRRREQRRHMPLRHLVLQGQLPQPHRQCRPPPAGGDEHRVAVPAPPRDAAASLPHPTRGAPVRRGALGDVDGGRLSSQQGPSRRPAELGSEVCSAAPDVRATRAREASRGDVQVGAEPARGEEDGHPVLGPLIRRGRDRGQSGVLIGGRQVGCCGRGGDAPAECCHHVVQT
mmetsp:Transcript_7596/g.14307  ORF Transcript_7596/g.14307 Transcript_7596/m.14307 type:complete len:216 (+) Transcript_7596:1374-2021(+)